jgi:pyrimidine 5'-nucleotidase
MYYKCLFFDLDDTLYPAKSGLWDAIRDRMNTYMQKYIDLPISEIIQLRQNYLEKYGTTLRGLQAHYDIDADDYLAFVHDLPLEQYIYPDPDLGKILLSLPQHRWIFTNSDINHAHRVLKILGITDCFQGIIDIRAIDFACKPDKIAYQRALSIASNEDPVYSVIFDDSVRNLIPAREMGFYTVLVGNNKHDTSVDCVVPSLHELHNLLPQLWKNGD